LVLNLEMEINLLDFNLTYPKNPQTFGEALRKARMDKGMIIKELAAIIGVTDTSIINWEIRGKMPTGESLERVKRFPRFLEKGFDIKHSKCILMNV